MVKQKSVAWFELKLTLMGSAVSLQLITAGKRHCRVRRVVGIIVIQLELI